MLAGAVGASGGLPVAHHLGDLGDDLFAVAEHDQVDEVGDRLRVVGAVAPHHDERVLGPSVGGTDRDARQVDAVEEVRVGELGRQVEAQQVELAGGAVRVDREEREPPVAHERLEVDPRCVGALGEGVVALVQDLVEDLQTLVGQADLVGVGVDEQPPDVALAGLGTLRTVLQADVARRLLHMGQEGLERGPEGGHPVRAYPTTSRGGHAAAVQPTPENRSDLRILS